MADNPAGRFTIGRKRHYFSEWTDPEPTEDGTSRRLHKIHADLRPMIDYLHASVARVEAATDDQAERRTRINEFGHLTMNVLVNQAQRDVMAVFAQHKKDLARLTPIAPADARAIAAQIAAMGRIERGAYLHKQALKANPAVWGTVLAYPKESGFSQLCPDTQDLFKKLYFRFTHPQEMARIAAEHQQASTTLHALKATAQAVLDEAPATLFACQQIAALNAGEKLTLERKRIPVVVEKADSAETPAPKDQAAPMAVGGQPAAFFTTAGGAVEIDQTTRPL